MSAAMKILDWRAMRRNSLLGFVKVELPSGMVIADVTILSGDKGAWASPPSKPLIGRDGAVLKDAAGKARYQPIIDFTSKEVRNRFSEGVVAALRAAHPEALS
jgi:DNA-binding cell septation regulator SpoVG